MADFKYENCKAVLYARVSTEEQASRDNSIPAQIKAIKQFAKSNGIEIISEYIDEGKSARTADRPQFQQMISDAKKKDKLFSLILIHKTDRFARNRSDSVIYKSLLKRECSVEVISVTEVFDDSPTGKLLEGMMEVIAEFHSLNLAQEVMKGMKQKAASGVYLGRSPFGYSLDENTRKLIVNDNEAKIVKMIFEMYSCGDSFSTIKSYLNTIGIITREGKPWDSSAIKRIIKNSAYIGQYTWNKTKKSSNSEKDSDEWIVVENSHEAIITQELFDNVQNVLKSKSTMAGPAVKSQYLLSSLIKCGHCGHNMIGDRKRHGCGKVYTRYVCGHHLRHKMCFFNFVHKDAIEKLVFEEIKKIVENGNVDRDKVVIVETNNSTSEKDLLDAQLKKIKHKFQRQFEAYESGIISLEELQEAKSRVVLEEQEIEAKISTLEVKLKEKEVGNRLKNHFEGVEEVFASNDSKSIKLWLKERICSIEVFNKSEVVIKYKLPW